MANAPTGSDDIRFGRETLRRLGRAVANFGRSEFGGQAKLLAALLVAFLFAINGLNVLNSYVARDFMTAIQMREGATFVAEAIKYSIVFALLTVAAVLYRFTEERLGLVWREHITRRVVAGYLEDGLYYRLAASGTVTNPDQRIADDVRTFTTSTLSLCLIFFNGALTILSFSGVLWSISRLLFVVAVVYAALGSLVAFVLGRPLVQLNYNQADKEADFRSALIHIRENTESVALLHRESHLLVRLLARVDGFVGNMKQIIAVNRNLGFFTTGYNYFIQLIPMLIVAPMFIYGSADFGVISQSTMAFAHVLGAFSLLVTQFPALSSYAAVLARLSPIAGLVDMTPELRSDGRIEIVEDDSRFALEGLTLESPQDRQILVRALTLNVEPRARLLVTANRVRVVDAIQRAVVGIWQTGEGRIVRPHLEKMQVLPERPYLPPGKLRDLLDGNQSNPADDEKIWAELRRVGVDHAVERVGGLDVEHDWDDLLDVEEQRLVLLARVLIASPRFAVISHLGGCLGASGAATVLEVLAAAGVGCVALGDGTLRPEDFDAVIDIAADGTWSHTPQRNGEVRG